MYYQSKNERFKICLVSFVSFKMLCRVNVILAYIPILICGVYVASPLV